MALVLATNLTELRQLLELCHAFGVVRFEGAGFSFELGPQPRAAALFGEMAPSPPTRDATPPADSEDEDEYLYTATGMVPDFSSIRKATG